MLVLCPITYSFAEPFSIFPVYQSAWKQVRFPAYAAVYKLLVEVPCKCPKQKTKINICRIHNSRGNAGGGGAGGGGGGGEGDGVEGWGPPPALMAPLGL